MISDNKWIVAIIIGLTIIYCLDIYGIKFGSIVDKIILPTIIIIIIVYFYEMTFEEFDNNYHENVYKYHKENNVKNTITKETKGFKVFTNGNPVKVFEKYSNY